MTKAMQPMAHGSAVPVAAVEGGDGVRIAPYRRAMREPRLSIALN